MGTAFGGTSEDSLKILKAFGLDKKDLIKCFKFSMGVNEMATLDVTYIATKEQINAGELSEIFKRYRLEEIDGGS